MQTSGCDIHGSWCFQRDVAKFTQDWWSFVCSFNIFFLLQFRVFGEIIIHLGKYNPYSSRKEQVVGLLLCVLVNQCLWLQKVLVSEPKGCVNWGGEKPMSLEGFCLCTMSYVLRSFGYNSISFGSCSNPVPAVSLTQSGPKIACCTAQK